MGRSWWLFFTLTFFFNNLSEAIQGKKLPSAIVVGTVYCDTCLQQDFSKNSHFISGASVAVECGHGNSSPTFYEEVKTSKHGEFKIHLPFPVSKHVKRIKRCSVKLINSNEPFCDIPSSATPSFLSLKSRNQGIHIFSAGFFTFKPLKQPKLCNEKPSLTNPKSLNSMKFLSSPILPIFPPRTEDPTTPNLTQLPYLSPLPALPQLPNFPPLPYLPGLPISPPLSKEKTEPKTIGVGVNVFLPGIPSVPTSKNTSP